MASELCLVSGAGGFLGRYLTSELARRGYGLLLLDRPESRGEVDVCCDLSVSVPNLREYSLKHVFHLAGLAHVVPRTPQERKRFYQINVDGTRNLLSSLEHVSSQIDSLTLVSSVAVYGVETGELLDETTERNAVDPYGESKRLAEDLVMEWSEGTGVRYGIVRLPLVIGCGAPGNFGAMVRAFRGGWYLAFGNGECRRSMVLAQDVASGLAAVSCRGGTFHLTDGEHPRMRDLEAVLGRATGRRWVPRVPAALAFAIAKAGDLAAVALRRQMPFDTHRYRRLTSTLTFSDQRARRDLGWRPRPVLSVLPGIIDK